MYCDEMCSSDAMIRTVNSGELRNDAIKDTILAISIHIRVSSLGHSIDDTRGLNGSFSDISSKLEQI